MKRTRTEMPTTDSSVKLATSGKIFYDCPYSKCPVRAHNQHNLEKHIVSHIEKENKKKDKDNSMKM